MQLTGQTNGLMLYGMKNRFSSRPLTALAIMAMCGQIAPVLVAQDATPASTNAGVAVAAPVSEARPVQLSSGAAEILKLRRAKLSDEVITAFVKNSGRTYTLSTSEILYLHEQGVPDPVVTAMLDQRQNVVATAAQTAPSTIQSGSAHVEAAPVYVQPSPVYVYSSPGYSYYDYGYYDSWPYYGGYWGYPAWSFSFGYWGGHSGGFHGGGYHGGGYPGGGHSGGGPSGGGHSGGGSPGGGHGGGGGGHR
jgi:hypothetical protein